MQISITTEDEAVAAIAAVAAYLETRAISDRPDDSLCASCTGTETQKLTRKFIGELEDSTNTRDY